MTCCAVCDGNCTSDCISAGEGKCDSSCAAGFSLTDNKVCVSK